MVKRLVAVAKELNVGTGTIVEHLTQNGFEIQNKPNAKLSPDMYEELLREFQGSISIKEKADQLTIGQSAGKKEEDSAGKDKRAPVEDKSAAKKPVEKQPTEKAKEEVIQEKKTEEPEVETPDEAVKETETEDKKVKGPKVLGKIDLDSLGKGKKKKKEEETEKRVDPEDKKDDVDKKEQKTEKKAPDSSEKEEDKSIAAETEDKKTEKVDKVEEEVDEKETKAPASDKKEEKSNDPDEVVKGKVPQLKGLKVVGKVDASKFADKKKTKGTKSKKAEEAAAESGTKRRRRKRTKVAPRSARPGKDSTARRGRRRKDEVREVSQKEIDEQIKATLARLSGTGSGSGKSKRQKIKRDQKGRIKEQQEAETPEAEDKQLQVTEFISVTELANLMDVSPTDVITNCMNLGVIVSINQRLDAEIIELVAQEFGFETEFISAEEQTIEDEEIEDDEEDMVPRAPIVTVMGHVDHGKTSLLDYIRSTKVAAGEAGGITQHIGAYEVKVGEDDRGITFLDTPGHEAFTAMRARGAKVTDVAVIIVAADDRIMPQTKEAISHAQAAGVPIVFAINKIDKPGADPERIKQELANLNLLVEEWGGKYQSQDISALKGTHVDELLEKILLEADLLELQANPDRRAIGTVIEASLDKGRGYVTKVLVQTGTLKMGDTLVAGEYQGKIKAMFNEFGVRIKEAGPSKPVMILGLSGAPQAGEQFKVMEQESEAKDLANRRAQINREQSNRASKRISLDEIGRRLALGTFKELNLIVKGDVDGSIEALSDVLIKLSIESVQVNVIHKAVGQIIESDVLLASASDAIIIGFQVRPSLGARKLAEKEGVQIRMYSIIYEAIEEIKSAIQGMLEPVREEKIVANLEVRETYKISKVGTVAGCYVQDGKIHRNSYIRVIREGIVIYPTKEGVTGEISSLKRFKEDVREVKTGLECGLTIKNFNDIKVGDTIEAYEVIEVKAELQ